MTARNKLLRLAKRGSYDRDAVYAVVDAALVCHVGYAIDGQPYVLPTLHARDRDTLLLHGPGSNRTLLHAGGGAPVCVAVTHIDGVVLARSIFNHSINYRSAPPYGTGRLLTDRGEKMDGLFRFSEKVLPGRWDDVREMSDQEFKVTAIVAMNIEDASPKVRTGPPVDERDDLSFPTWARVIPLRVAADAPVADAHTPATTSLPAYLADWLARQDGHPPHSTEPGSAV